MWIKLTEDGNPRWINANQVRIIAQARRAGTVLIFTSQHEVVVSETLHEVMKSMGYDPPPPLPIEVHEPAAEEEAATA
jgi:hypothetical protein